LKKTTSQNIYKAFSSAISSEIHEKKSSDTLKMAEKQKPTRRQVLKGISAGLATGYLPIGAIASLIGHKRVENDTLYGNRMALIVDYYKDRKEALTPTNIQYLEQIQEDIRKKGGLKDLEKDIDQLILRKK